MGLYLEEFEENKVYAGEARRTVNAEDVAAYAALCGDFAPQHVDAAYAAATPVGERTAHSLLGAGLLQGLIGSTGLVDGTAVSLVEAAYSFRAPIRYGDTLRVELTPRAVIASPQNPRRGVLKLHCRLLNQRDEPVIECLQSLLMRTRADG